MQEKYKDQPFSDNKVIGVVVAVVSLGLLLVFLANISTTMLSGARALIDGEGVWSKAQKQAVLHLVRYVQYGESTDFEKFDRALEISRGYRQARVELDTENPDYDLIREGFGQGRNNPEDIPDIIWIYRNFSWSPYMQKATTIWERGEKKILELEQLGEKIYQEIINNRLSASEKRSYIRQIYSLDSELTDIESTFSQTISRSTILISKVVYWSTLGIGFVILIGGGFVSIRFLRNVRTWGESLAESEQKFRNVLENSRDVIYQMDLDTGEYIYVSPSVKDMIGYSAEELLQGGTEFIIKRIHPDDYKRMEEELEGVRSEGSVENFNKSSEFRIKAKNGEYIWVSNKRTLLRDDENKPVGVVGSVRDISDQKKYEKQIDDSLKEKEILLQEIHHRVKNNLAVIISLLELQKDELDDNMRAVFQESQARIQSIALVHERLYQSKTLSDISIADYIRELTEVISSAYHTDYADRTIRLIVDHDVKLSINKAVPMGLIYNELVNNAYKHGFNGKEKGILKIKLSCKEGKVILSVADNGKGLPEDFDFEGSGSLGMTLINTLSKQLEAEVEISTGEWTQFKISFERED